MGNILSNESIETTTTKVDRKRKIRNKHAKTRKPTIVRPRSYTDDYFNESNSNSDSDCDVSDDDANDDDDDDDDEDVPDVEYDEDDERRRRRRRREGTRLPPSNIPYDTNIKENTNLDLNTANSTESIGNVNTIENQYATSINMENPTGSTINKKRKKRKTHKRR